MNRVGFLATLFRFGQQDLIEDLTSNPFERVTVVTAQRKRATKDRRAFTVEELNRIFASKLYTGGYQPRPGDRSRPLGTFSRSASKRIDALFA